jgi:ABC-2 type transport system ATP-binding protein
VAAVITAGGVTRFYGRHWRVVDLELEVRPGEVFGYLGPNRAGTTTTIRPLLNLIRPGSGTVGVLGEP